MHVLRLVYIVTMNIFGHCNMELQNNFDKCIVTADTACETACETAIQQQGCTSTPAIVICIHIFLHEVPPFFNLLIHPKTPSYHIRKVMSSYHISTV